MVNIVLESNFWMMVFGNIVLLVFWLRLERKFLQLDGSFS